VRSGGISLSSCYDWERVQLLQQWMERTKGLPLDIFICAVHKNQEMYSNPSCWTHDDSQYHGALKVLAAIFFVQWRNVHLQLPYVILEPFHRTLRGIPNIDSTGTEVEWYARLLPTYQEASAQYCPPLAGHETIWRTGWRMSSNLGPINSQSLLLTRCAIIPSSSNGWATCDPITSGFVFVRPVHHSPIFL